MVNIGLPFEDIVPYNVDANQKTIEKFLHDLGASYQSIAMVGYGCVDMLVGWQGVNHLWEIKQPGKKLRRNQRLWHEAWKGRAVVIHSAEEAARELGVEM